MTWWTLVLLIALAPVAATMLVLLVAFIAGYGWAAGNIAAHNRESDRQTEQELSNFLGSQCTRQGNPPTTLTQP